METLLAVLAVGLSAHGPAMADPLLRDFATCAGRLSALVEHQWLVDGPSSEVSARERDSLIALVEAVAGPQEAKAALAWRIEAKAAQAALLSRATFAQDLTAARRANQLVQNCRSLIGQS